MTDDVLTTALLTDTDAGLALAGRRMTELTDDEFWWEPVPGCWTVRRAADAVPGVIPPMGEWAVDGLFMYPEPPPFTTIAWRLNHMMIVIAGYHDLFGSLEPEGRVCGSAAASVAEWTRVAMSFREAIANLTPEAARERVLVEHWGREVERWSIVGHVLRDEVHHGAEIGVLRDLYRARRLDS